MSALERSELTETLEQLTGASPIYPFKQMLSAGIRGVMGHRHKRTDADIAHVLSTAPLRSYSTEEMLALARFLALRSKPPS
jgi:hypothetical protein